MSFSLCHFVAADRFMCIIISRRASEDQVTINLIFAIGEGRVIDGDTAKEKRFDPAFDPFLCA